ncbi:hypothetical protein OCS_06286 [Ophiocordyceps sinensis CO18]|uniref:Uncharacterized protein n=1 Tax=Ophiocordyceps sinensis (strain Co18 / CGMCC 3.14243) TaxID=911162 RepID=T5A8B6_OPHSC|nr:hypothetical protein OCS_06286 [Ophiocordyceps sinensis CO18]
MRPYDDSAYHRQRKLEIQEKGQIPRRGDELKRPNHGPWLVPLWQDPVRTGENAKRQPKLPLLLQQLPQDDGQRRHGQQLGEE